MGSPNRSSTEYGLGTSADDFRDERFDLTRYIHTVRRHLYIIALTVLLFTLVVVAASLAIRPSFSSTAQVRLNSTLGASDTGGQNRELATLQVLVTTTPVLTPAAKALNVPVGDLRSWVSTTIGSEANILSIRVVAPESALAQPAAQGVADSLLQVVAERKRARLSDYSEQLARRLEVLAAEPDAEAAARIELLEARQSEAEAEAAAVGADLEVVEPAQPPAQADGANVVRNGVLAFFGGTVGALLVLLRLSRAGTRDRLAGAAEHGPEPKPDGQTQGSSARKRSKSIVLSRRVAMPRISGASEPVGLRSMNDGGPTMRRSASRSSKGR